MCDTKTGGVKIKKAKIRCAIVGLGRIGSTLEDDRLREKPCTHAGAIMQNDECALVGGCDVSSERRVSFSKRWGCRAVYSTVEKLIKHTKPDILHIATPPETHLEIVEQSVNSGVRLIICEKPLAHTGSTPTCTKSANVVRCMLHHLVCRHTIQEIWIVS